MVERLIESDESQREQNSKKSVESFGEVGLSLPLHYFIFDCEVFSPGRVHASILRSSFRKRLSPEEGGRISEFLLGDHGETISWRLSAY
ncbi:MAG: hypothetical protein KCHDKBKB_01636 [Elusimicrobia bacterium]|nr:hypothetical protein [Elusimicrobiota bacterium]